MSDIGDPPFCGFNFAQITDIGGNVNLGWIEFATEIQWDRRRDDISQARVKIPIDCCPAFLSNVHTIQNELHIYRTLTPEAPTETLESVWQGVITRMEFSPNEIEIFASDMLWVTSRRAMGYGYDHRAAPVPVLDVAEYLLDTLCFGQFDDPWNMVPHLHKIVGTDPAVPDPRTTRQVNAWQFTCFTEFDKLGADHGIDYTVVNRDIYYYDINLRWLILPSVTQDDFSQDPRVVEYGSQYYNRYFHTDGGGWAAVADAGAVEVARTYAFCDLLHVTMTETELRETGEPPTQAQKDDWVEAANDQIVQGHPQPLSVIIPSRATLLPSAGWDINKVVPGSWFQVSVDNVCRPMEGAWKRLHAIRVKETSRDGEKVSISAVDPPSTFKENP